jgi:hypothetical protein
VRRLPLALCLAFAPSPARAQDQLRRIDLAWVRGVGAEGCVPQSQARAALRTRTRHDPLDPSAPVSAEVLLTREPAAWRAALTLRTADGVVILQRDLRDEGPTCATLTEAVLESLTLSLDPDPPAPPPAPTPAPAPPPVAEAPPPPRRRPRRPASPPAVRISVEGDLLVGPLPQPGLGLRGHASVRLPVAGLRVWGAMAFTPEQRTPAPSSFWAFGMTRASVGVAYGGAPLAWLDLSVEAGLCAAFAHGVALRGEPVSPGNYPWLAVTVGGRVALHPTAGFAVTLSVEGHAAALRNDFVVEGRSGSVFSQPVLGMAAQVGLSLAR